MLAYHDTEWGVPQHEERALFELLILEGAQAGLSWSTILRRRENYRQAFEGFDVSRVAAFDDRRIEALLKDNGIIRNRQKIVASVENARRVLQLQREGSSLDAFVWSFVGDVPLVHGFRGMSERPASTPESEAMSKALKKRGFGFVGPTICYAFMQSAGLINDHVVSCFRFAEVQR